MLVLLINLYKMATSQAPVNTLGPRSECVYTSCYCEENIWKICETVRYQGTDALSQFKVLFISNLQKTVAFWSQKLGEANKDVPVVWDYHVILLHKAGDNWNAYDLDTTLNFPVSLETYVEESFCPKIKKLAMYKPIFRVVDPAAFLESFSSDRSHMMNRDGTYKSPPPEYPPIMTGMTNSNLFSYMSMKSQPKRFGKVYPFKEFIKVFAQDSLPTKDPQEVVESSSTSEAWKLDSELKEDITDSCTDMKAKVDVDSLMILEDIGDVVDSELKEDITNSCAEMKAMVDVPMTLEDIGDATECSLDMKEENGSVLKENCNGENVDQQKTENVDLIDQAGEACIKKEKK